MSVLDKAVPRALRGYQRGWLGADVVAGVTLAAIAIPEVMGYTSISRTPIQTGLYTIIFPTALFALLGSSKLLVVGADSATAALLAAGLGALGISGLSPDTPLWVAYCGFIALLCGGLLILARVFRLGFLGDFLSSSVLVGFLTGVGVQVATGQIPGMLGIPKGAGNWFEQQWHWMSNLDTLSWWTTGFALATVLIILVFKHFAPRVPGALIAVVLLIIVSTAADATAHGVKVVGSVKGGFPPVGLPKGISSDNLAGVVAIAVSCFVLIIAQSAATSRSFAMRHGDKVDVNRDLVGLAGANLAAGVTGTFVVNGSPTKTQILEGSRGRTQVANLTMAVVALLFTMFATALLKNMPNAVLDGIVFLIGVDLIDVAGLRRVYARRVDEFVIAVVTAAVVCAVGVEQGIILAIVVSILEIIRRQYRPRNYVVRMDANEQPTYLPSVSGTVSEPGLIAFRYDADLFYANANSFVEELQRLVDSAPRPVRWVIIDAGAFADIDYSAGLALEALLDWLGKRGVSLALARADTGTLDALERYGVLERIPEQLRFANLDEAVAAFRGAQGNVAGR